MQETGIRDSQQGSEIKQAPKNGVSNPMKTKYNSTPSATDARSHDGTPNNSIRRKRSPLALRGFFLASILALSVSSVKAQCTGVWDVGGEWGLKQGSIRNAMSLYQNGTAVSGKASFETNQPGSDGFLGIVGKKYGGTGTVNGSVAGTVTGDNFYIKIVWDNQTTGVYNGKIGPQGQLTGSGYEIRSPSKKVPWFSDRPMKCPPAQAPPTPKPIRRSGGVRTPTLTPAPTPTPTPARHKPNKGN
jgi:hypothetical protein